jgi:hypothetical protein
MDPPPPIYSACVLLRVRKFRSSGRSRENVRFDRQRNLEKARGSDDIPMFQIISLDRGNGTGEWNRAFHPFGATL